MRYLATVLVLLMLAGVAGAQSTGAAQSPVSVAVVLRPGDMIRLEVPDVADMSGEFAIADDGVVLLPLIGAVVVAGRPFDEVSRDIVKAYSRELLETPMRVMPVLRIAVLGEVREPGLVPADPTFTLTDVLAAAGGLTPDGDAGNITLLREGRSTRFSLDDSAALLSSRLMPGDQVVVGRRGWIARNANVLIGAAASVVAAAVTSLILR